MAVTVAQLLIQVDANVEAAVQGIESVNTEMINLVRAVNNLNAPLQQMLGQMQQVRTTSVQAAQAHRQHVGALQELTDWFGKGAAAFAGFVAARVGYQLMSQAVSGLLEVTIGYNSQLETTQNAMAAMLRGTNASTGALNDMSVGMERARALTYEFQRLALASPFEFKDIQRTAGELIRYGIAIKDVVALTADIQNVGAAIAASGGDAAGAMERLAYALGQVHASGVVRGQELRQLYNAGVNIGEVYAIVGKEINKTAGEVAALQEAGKLQSDVFIAAFQKWSQINFGDMAAIQSRTFSGAMNNIKEAINIVGSTAFAPLFRQISLTAQKIAEFAGNQEFRVWAAGVGAVIEAVANGIGQLAGIFASALGAVLDVVVTIGQLIYQAMQWLNPFATHSPSLVDSVESGLERVRQAFDNLGRDVPAAIQPAADALVAFREMVGNFKETRDIEEAVKALGYVNADAPAAYLALRDAIASIREEAKALTPEILAQKEAVRDLTDQYKKAKAAVKEIDDQIKEFKKTLQPIKDDIRDVNIEMLGWKAQLAEVNVQILEETARLKPYRDEVKAAQEQQKEHEMQLREVNARLSESAAGLVEYKSRVAELKSELVDMNENLSLAKDHLSDLNREVSKTKDLMNNVISKPFQGERELTVQILQQRQQVEKISAQLLQAKSRGAQAEVTRIQKDLDKARAQLDILDSRKQGFATQRELLKAQADQVGPQGGSFAQRQEDLKGFIDTLGDLIPKVDAAQKDVDIAQGVVDTQKALISPLEAIIRQRERMNAADLAEKAHLEAVLDIDKNRVTQAQLNLEKESGTLDKLKDQQTELNEILGRLQARKDVLEAQLAVDSKELIFLEEERDRRREIADNLNTDLDDAKTLFSDLKAAQQVLVDQASAWEQELSKVVQEARQLQSEQEAAAKKAAKAGGAAGAFGVGDRLAGADESLANAKAKVAELDKAFADARVAVKGFFDTLGEFSINDEVFAALDTFRTKVAGFMKTEDMDKWSAALAAASQSVGEVFGPDAQRQFDDWTQHAGDAFSNFGSGIQTDVLPWLGSMKDTIVNETIPQGLEVLRAFIGDDLDRELGLLKDTIKNDALDPLGELKDHIVDHVIAEGLLPLVSFLGTETGDALQELKRKLIDDVAPAFVAWRREMIEQTIPNGLEKLEGFLKGPMNTALTNFKNAFTDEGGILSTLGTFAGNIASMIGNELTNLWNYWTININPIFVTFNSLVGAAVGILGELGKAALALVTDVLGVLFKNIDKESGGINKAWDEFKTLIEGTKTALGDLKTWFANEFAGFLKTINDALVNGPLATLTNMLTKLQEWNNRAPQAAPVPHDGASGAPDNSQQTGGISSIPSVARGGFFDRPSVALIGDNAGPGGEWALPDDKLRQMIREESGNSASAEDIGSAVAAALKDLGIVMDGDKVGTLVLRRINSQISNLQAVGA